MLLHEVLSVFFVLCFCFIGGVVEFIARGCLSFVTRGCLSCYSGCFCFLFGVFSVGGVGGGMRRLSFLESCTRNLRYYKSPELGLNLSGS